MALGWMRTHKKKMYIVMVFAMAAWGIGFSASYLIPKKPVGTIMGQKVSVEEFNDAMMRWHRIFLKQENLPLGKLVWEQLTLVKQAESMGIAVSNDEVIDRIKTLGATVLGNSDVPTGQIIKLLCQSYMVTEAQLLMTYREALLIEKMHVLLSGNVKMTKGEAWEIYARDNEEAKIEFVTLRARDLAKNISVTDEEITAFYNEHKNNFSNPSEGIIGYKEPEKTKIEYLMARYRDVKKNVTVTEDEIQAYYDENKEVKYKKEEKPENDGDKKAEDKKPQPPQYKPFEEVQADIRKLLEREKSKELVNQLISTADETIYERLGRTEQISFSDIGGSIGMFHKESDYFTREESKDVIRDADKSVYSRFFEREKYDPSPPLDAPAGKLIFQVISVKEPSAPPLEAIREKVTQDVKEEKALAKARELAERFVEKVNKTSFEEGLELLNKEGGSVLLSKRETGFFTRPEIKDGKLHRYINELEADVPHVATNAFKLSPGKLGIVTEETGDKTVYTIRLTEKKAADKKKFDEDRENLARKYLMEKQKRFVSHWSDSIKKKARLTK
ncbi:MAG: peptidyl-prolyl isomerase family protein [Planctomycetota bacterium]|jgi:peptidyl-prolyl cis-trans isomerase D